jgi:hypothetical protein
MPRVGVFTRKRGFPVMSSAKSQRAERWRNLYHTRINQLKAVVRRPSEPTTRRRPIRGEMNSAYESPLPTHNSFTPVQRQPLAYTMAMNTGDQNCLVQSLPDENGAITNVTNLGEWVKTAPFVTFEKYEVCADNPGLVDNSHEFRKSVEDTLIKVCFSGDLIFPRSS